MKRLSFALCFLGVFAPMACSVVNAPDDVKPGPAGAGGTGAAGGAGSTGGAGGAAGTCGDGVLDANETCDPPASCPVSCDDGVACTVDSASGSAAACNVTCDNAPITGCSMTADGCCPAGCNPLSDVDCGVCGNGMVEPNETCDDGPGSPTPCPVACDDGDVCTFDALSGSPASCDVACTPTNISQCIAGDGCCPLGCTLADDTDCCGTDCFGPTGCLTGAGRCVRFTCRGGDAGPNFCASCLGPGWKEVSTDQWFNAGYCADVIARYRDIGNVGGMCGDPGQSCCDSNATCMGGDSAWHLYNFAAGSTYYVGPDVAWPDDMNCMTWNSPETSSYSRITVCER